MRQVAGIESINLTPMIDIVFQIIIFFILTIDLDKVKFNDDLELEMAKEGIAVEDPKPETIYIEVSADGRIYLGRTRYSPGALYNILKDSRGRFGQGIPVVIYGDGRTRHAAVRNVLDIISRAGLWKISFAAIKEKAKGKDEE